MNEPSLDHGTVEAAAQAVRQGLPAGAGAEWAIVVGSGLGVLATLGRELGAIEYGRIPGLGGSAVAGHESRWVLAEANGRKFYCLLGRRHLYEGIAPPAAALAMRVLAVLGVKQIVLTNAAGGLGPDLYTGDLMLIRDHLSLMFRNPFLGGEGPPEGGGPGAAPRSGYYDAALGSQLAASAVAEGIELKEGVYGAVCGPNYETRAEVAMLRRLGADAVGMSTVPEALAAVRAGVRVAAVSLITNSHWHRGGPASHGEVLEAAARSGRRLRAVLGRLLMRG